MYSTYPIQVFTMVFMSMGVQTTMLYCWLKSKLLQIWQMVGGKYDKYIGVINLDHEHVKGIQLQGWASSQRQEF